MKNATWVAFLPFKQDYVGIEQENQEKEAVQILVMKKVVRPTKLQP